MELRQLKYFLKAKELLNFTEAAKELFISQSTLSQQIKQLEDELDIPLFDRIGKRILLTEAGNLFAEFASKSVQASTEGKLMLEDLKQVQTGTLYIGLTWGLKSIVINTFKNFIAHFPKIKLQVTFGTTAELMNALLKKEIDFAVTFYEGKHSDELNYTPLMQSEMAVIVSDKSELAKLKSIGLNDIKNLNLALPVKGFSTRDFLDLQFDKYKIVPNITFETNYTDTIIDLVKTGSFQTILTMATIHDENNICPIPIKNMNMKREADIITLKDSYQKKAAQFFIRLLLEEDKEEYNKL